MALASDNQPTKLAQSEVKISALANNSSCTDRMVAATTIVAEASFIGEELKKIEVVAVTLEANLPHF